MGFLIIVFCVLAFGISLTLMFSKARWFIFYFGMWSLILQLILYTKWAQTIYDSFSNLPAYVEVMAQINPGLLWSFVAAVFPFPLPAVAAYLIGSVTVNPQMGLIAFFFFSLVQVILLGFTTKSASTLERALKAITGYAIPLFSTLIALTNLFLPEGQRLSGFESIGNGLALTSLCCCLFLVYLILMGVLYYFWKKK
jgi:hypothetical protein